MTCLHRSPLALTLACGLACSSNQPTTSSCPPFDGAVQADAAARTDVAVGTDAAAAGDAAVRIDAAAPTDGVLPEPWPDNELRLLIGQMTLEEKIAQLGNRAPAIPRLNIPSYDYWNECLHGVWAGGATSFPQAIALASTWDPTLVEQVASAISDEARAFHVKDGKGLTYWAPVINMLRDPRWGRYEESYSEDPWLMARIAVAYVHGLQGRDSKFLKVVATPKHFAGNNSEYNRHNGSSDIDEQLLHEYYLPAFEATVREGGAFSVMAAYNEVNGVPASANPMLLKDILRGAWGFRGYVVSDCDAVSDIYYGHSWTDSLTRAAAAALVAGTDLNCGTTYPRELLKAFQLGFVAESDIDTALTRVLRARFLLGEFSPASQVPYSSIDESVIQSKTNSELALKAARAAIVLLKNGGGLLPLASQSLRSIAVIGPHAADVTLGGYSGYPDHTVSVLDAIKARFASTGVMVNYQAGCAVSGSDSSGIAGAAEAARSSDVAVVLVGTSQGILSEEVDRPDWSLPGAQGDLIQAVFAANPKTVVVLVTAGPVAVDWAQANVPAILSAFYDGQEQGTAITDVLFGDVVPGGRLTTTWYTGSATLPPIGDYDLRKGRTYLYYNDRPLYPFGFGLSYTTFAYANLRVKPDVIDATGSTTVTVDVSNTGPLAGDEVVQMYVRDREASVVRPIQELRGFQKIHLNPGESRTVEFALPARNLAFWDSDKHDWKVEEGGFEIAVASSSVDIRLRGALTVASAPDAAVSGDGGSD
jgi:beta-glucosidase